MLNNHGKTEIQNARNSSLELLRIIAMLFIVLSHACAHSRFDYSLSGLSWNKLFVQWGALGHIGSGLFMLISGYFLCTKRRNYQSLIRLFLQVWFYSVILFLVCKFGFQYPYSLYDYVTVFFPAVFQEYWFFTVYTVIILLCPYINLFLEKGGREAHRDLLVVMFFLWVLIPTFTLQSIFGSSLIQMLFYYIVGAYFRLYPEYTLKNKRIIIGYTIAGFALLFTSTFMLDYLGESIDLFRDKGDMFYTKESLLIVMSAIGMFSYFVKMKPFSNRSIDKVAACMFGVYLIHDNPAVRDILWLRIFRHAEYFASDYLIANIVVSVGLVFCVSTLIEYLRIQFLGKYFNKISVCMEKSFHDIVSICRRLLEHPKAR